MNHNDASSIALAVTLGETEKTHDAKRELFEAAAFDEYQRRYKGSPDGQMGLEEFTRKDFRGVYFYTELNVCWWGFQAGFMAAALAGSTAVNDAAAG